MSSIKYILMVLSLPILTACGGAASSGPKYESTALYFGDSLTAWGTFPAQTAEQLGLAPINYGRPSSLVGDELSLNIKRAREAKAEACFIMFGFNDAHDASTPLSTYKAQLNELVGAASTSCAAVYVATQPKALGRPDWTQDGFYAAATRQVVQELNLSNVRLVDIYSLFNYNPATELTPDNVHFNVTGNAHLSAVWKASL